MPLQNVSDCGVGEDVAQIGERTLNPPITPSTVFSGHTNNEVRNLRRSRGPSGRSVRTAIVLLGDQLPMPRQ